MTILLFLLSLIVPQNLFAGEPLISPTYWVEQAQPQVFFNFSCSTSPENVCAWAVFDQSNGEYVIGGSQSDIIKGDEITLPPIEGYYNFVYCFSNDCTQYANYNDLNKMLVMDVSAISANRTPQSVDIISNNTLSYNSYHFQSGLMDFVGNVYDVVKYMLFLSIGFFVIKKLIDLMKGIVKDEKELDERIEKVERESKEIIEKIQKNVGNESETDIVTKKNR